MTKAVWGLAAAAAIMVILSARPGAAQRVNREPVQPTRDLAGAATYKAYCAQCHGVSGKGDGPVARALKVPPADLTQMAKRHEGRFPAGGVKQTILGWEVEAHGTREMPAWGPVLRSVEDPSVTELRLANLIKYLEQIQQK